MSYWTVLVSVIRRDRCWINLCCPYRNCIKPYSNLCLREMSTIDYVEVVVALGLKWPRTGSTVNVFLNESWATSWASLHVNGWSCRSSELCGEMTSVISSHWGSWLTQRYPTASKLLKLISRNRSCRITGRLLRFWLLSSLLKWSCPVNS